MQGTRNAQGSKPRRSPRVGVNLAAVVGEPKVQELLENCKPPNPYLVRHPCLSVALLTKVSVCGSSAEG